MDRMQPTDMCYLIPGDQQGLTAPNNNSSTYAEGDVV